LEPFLTVPRKSSMDLGGGKVFALFMLLLNFSFAKSRAPLRRTHTTCDIGKLIAANSFIDLKPIAVKQFSNVSVLIISACKLKKVLPKKDLSSKFPSYLDLTKIGLQKILALVWFIPI
jgi:hypothetical protein